MNEKQPVSPRARAGPGLGGALIYFTVTGLIALILILFREIAFRNPLMADHYTRWIFIPLATVWTWPVSRFSFSLTELFLVIGTPVLFLLLILAVIRLCKSRGFRLRLLVKSGLVTLGTTCLLLSLFMIFHGLNYARPPLAGKMGLELRERPLEELERGVRILAEAASRARDELPETENGGVDIGSLDHLWKTAFDGWDQAASRWPALESSVRARPKGVLLSHYWSYTHIVGLYMPLLVEPNVNIDQPAFMIPATAAHEIAHARGFASEGDSDFAAFLSCLYHPDPLWQYSGLISAWKSASHRLWEEDRDLWEAAYRDTLSPAVRSDLKTESAYWKGFESPVAEFSEKVNDAYLKANREEGVKSYGAVVDLLLAWLDTQETEGIRSGQLDIP